ncbi:MAG: 30S ribosomal protein S2 [Thermoplasmata archaeon]|nr:MAG: 30S ribosomal protein S2 [Thermoplasmata archaeon]RLF31802.1 MAG: 30S ribosomal protein S2 [Thermoplasmata archaeon]RLF52725.1 MAG: 30S ribosomal protein S2 [Thermoplasmata archaeon]
MTEDKKTEKKEETMLIPEETYMTSGAHIGTRQKTADIKDFIYKVRNDGLYIIDVKKTDERIKKAAKFISKYNPNDVLVVSIRQYGQKPIKKLGEYTGIQVIAGRFQPGTLTNPNAQGFIEPELLIVTDPLADQQALDEAKNVGIPVIGLCDTNNETKYLDLVIPTNNKGRRALALIYWVLAREILKNQGKIKSYDEFKPTVEEFEAEI